MRDGVGHRPVAMWLLPGSPPLRLSLCPPHAVPQLWSLLPSAAESAASMASSLMVAAMPALQQQHLLAVVLPAACSEAACGLPSAAASAVEGQQFRGGYDSHIATSTWWLWCTCCTLDAGCWLQLAHRA